MTYDADGVEVFSGEETLGISREEELENTLNDILDAWENGALAIGPMADEETIQDLMDRAATTLFEGSEEDTCE